jgi:hypothetical protein
MMLAVPRETAIAVTVFVVTVSVALPLIPFSVAVTVVDPAPTHVANPPDPIVATAVFPIVHLAALVTTAVEPSLYVAVAVNC